MEDLSWRPCAKWSRLESSVLKYVMMSLASPPQLAQPPATPQSERGGSAAPPSPRRLPGALLGVLAIALVLRLFVAGWLYGQPLYVFDENDYNQIALNLLRHGQFALEPGHLTSIRPPIYPALVAGVYAIAGEQNFTAVRVLQALLGTATVAVLYALARNMYGQRVGLIAAAIYACYPSLVATCGLLLTETLFTFLLCTACLLMQQFLVRGKFWLLPALGVALGVGALTRSVLWLFPPVLLVFLLVCDPAPRWRMRLLHAAVAIGTMIAVISPWAIRNTRLHHTFTAVDVMGGRNFMMGNYEYTPLDRPWDAISMSGEQSWIAVLKRNSPQESSELTQGQLDKRAMKAAVKYVVAHPGQTAQRDVAKFFHFWQLEREIVAGLWWGYWNQVPTLVVLAMAVAIVGMYVTVMLSGVMGAAVAPASSWRMQAFLILLIAFVCGIHTLVFGHSRYHLPLMPLIGVFAAVAWTSPVKVLAQWRRPALWLAGGFCVLLTASWCRELVIEFGRF